MENKIKLTKALSFIFLLVVLTLNITSVSATILDYDSNTRTATFHNNFLFFKTGEIATAQLITPLDYRVGLGEQYVWEQKIIGFDSYQNFISEMEFYDKKNGMAKINRDFDLRKKEIIKVSVDDYSKTIIGYEINGTAIYENIKIGSHLEDKEIWTELKQVDFKKNEVLFVRMYVNVQEGDHIEWIPTQANKRVFQWATWTADLNINILRYWKLDDNLATTVVIDSTGTENATADGNTNTLYTASGVVNSAFDFSVGSVGVESDSSLGAIPTISFWMKSGDALGGNQRTIGNRLNSAYPNGDFTLYLQTNGYIDINTKVSGVDTHYTGTTAIDDNAWHHIVILTGTGGLRVYLDNETTTPEISDAETTILGSVGTDVFTMGKFGVSGNYYYGDDIVDEVAIYSDRKTTAFVNEIYSANLAGFSYTDTFDTAPTVTLISPTNNTNYTSSPQSVNYICYGSDDTNFTEMEFYLNGSLTQTNSSGLNNTNYIFTESLTDGDYNWSCIGNDNNSQQTQSETWFLTVDTTPFIEFISPTPENYANITTPYLGIYVNTTTPYFKNITYYLQNINGTELITNFLTETYEYNFTGLPTAHYHYNVTICTTTDKCNYTETRHINHDSVLPSITDLLPNSIQDYFLKNNLQNITWNVSDINLDSCWVNYNGTNITVTCLDNLTQITIKDHSTNTLIFYANDTLGNLAQDTISWNYKVFENNQTFNNETTEGSLETFLANISLASGYSITGAVLINYNGSSETGQSFLSGGYTILRKTDLLISNVEADTNVTFYWNVSLSDGTIINLSSNNQTIYNLVIDNCSSGTVELFNFTVVDEETQDALPTATIETVVNIYDENRENLILNYSNLFEGLNPLRICINRNISSDSIYSVDTLVRYEDTGSANEYYNIVGQELTNGTETQKITLYDLNLTDSTDFQLSFTGSDFLPVENALVYVDRQYISENTFKTVELPKTDYNGQSVLHMVRNDVIYNIRIVKNGIVLGSFENLVAFCEDFTIGDCNIELNAFDSVENIFNTNTELGIIYTSPVYNKTENTISFNFITSDGSSKVVLLEVTRNDIFGNRSVCNSTITSSGGTLTCDIDPNIDESTLKVAIYVDGILTVSGSVDLDSNNFGVAGYLVMFVMALTFILMFSGSKTGVLISLGLTLAGSLGMGLVSGGLIGIGASGIWLLVIIFIGIYKLNKEKQP